jgi:nitrogen fixation NifU-like protein
MALRSALVRPLAFSLSRLSAAPLSVARRGYHANVVDHYENPRNVGSLPKDAPDVGTGLVGAPACGDVMKVQVKIDENGKIVKSVFKTFGCASAIASSSVATSWLAGKHVNEALTIKNSDIAKHLNLPPVKLHCSMLAEDAIKAAIADWKKKQAASSGAAGGEQAGQKQQAAAAH